MGNDGLVHSKSTSALSSLNQGDANMIGSKRSLVRRIANYVPMTKVQRPRFEILPNSMTVLEESKSSTIFSLSDIRRITNIPEVFSNKYLSNLLPRNKDREMTGSFGEIREAFDYDITPPVSPSPSVSISMAPSTIVESEIKDLKDELSALRAQIAQLITNKEAENSSAVNSQPNNTSTPLKGSCPIPPPSTPVNMCMGPPPPGIPPPPPPPPPPSTVKTTNSTSVQDLIRQRKIANGKKVDDETTQKKSPAPSMAEVLKNLHTVKLKPVVRPRGDSGKNSKKQKSVPVDDAGFISNALRKKFSHLDKARRDSPERSRGDDKEWMESPPPKIQFGQHLLKRRRPVPLPKSMKVINLKPVPAKRGIERATVNKVDVGKNTEC